MLNEIVLMGRLVKDPELRRTGSGVAVTSFRIACDRDYVPNGGERETDFIEIVAWRNTAEFVERNFRKGMMIAMHGRLQMRPWDDKDGKHHVTAEVVANDVYFADSKRPDNVNAAPVQAAPEETETLEDDDLPF